MAVTASAANVTNMTNWFLDQYFSPEADMVKVFNVGSPFFDEGLFGRVVVDVPDGGNQFVYPLQTSRYAGWAGRGDGATLAVARDAARERLYGTLFNHYQRGRFSGPGARRGRGKQFSFYTTIEHLLSDLPDDFSRFMAQACWRNGEGFIARCDVNPGGSDYGATAPMEVHPNHSVGDGTSTADYTWGTDHMHKGMAIDFWALSATHFDDDHTETHRTSSQIDVTDINTSSTFTTSADINAEVADNDYISWSVNSGETPAELHGLMAHISDGTPGNGTWTVHGIDKVANSWFQPAFVTGTEGSDTSFVLKNITDDLRSIKRAVGRTRMKDRMVGLTTPALWDIVANEMKESTEYRSDEFDMRWGWATVAIVRGGTRLTLVEDDDAAGGCIVYLHPDVFKFHQTSDPHIINDDGLTFRNISDKDMWEMMYGWEVEMVCTNPKFCGLRRGLAES